MGEAVPPGTRGIFVILSEAKNLGLNHSEHSPTKILRFDLNDK